MACSSALTLLIFLAAAGLTRADETADAGEIERRLHDWAKDFNARDAEAACGLFAPDLDYTVPGIDRGTREVMCANLARLLGREDIGFHYDTPAIHEVIVSGDLAVVRLTWTLTTTAKGESETTTEQGIDVFRRQPDGRWLIASFIAFTPDPKDG